MADSDLMLLYLVLVLTGLAIAAFYGEMRRRKFEPAPSEDKIFRCRGCGLVYTDDADVDRSRCSQCGQMNDAIEF